MIKKKGVQNIIRLAPLLLERDENLLFVMIGDGPLRERLEKKVEEAGLSRNFYFTGKVPREKVLGYLEQAISLRFLQLMKLLGFRFWKQSQKKFLLCNEP